jgi:hypothetical protein
MNLASLMNIPGFGMLGSGWEDKYVKVQKIDSKVCKYIRNFFIDDHTNMNCREMVFDHIKRCPGLTVTLENDDDHKLTDAYMDLIRPLIFKLVDSRIKWGLAVWKPIKKYDAAGNLYVIPHVIKPTTGSLYVCTNFDSTVEVKFVSDIVLDKSSNAAEFPVYVFPDHEPDEDGHLASPLFSMIMYVAYMLHRRNLDTIAAETLSRPPIVEVSPQNPMLDKALFDHLNKGMIPGLDPRGAGSGYAGPMSASPLGVSSDPRGAADRLKWLKTELDRMASERASVSGAELTWCGSDRRVPDELTGEWPVTHPRGPYHGNIMPLADGAQLAKQHLPSRDDRLDKLESDVKEAICTMWGVPAVFVNMRHAAYKDDMPQLTKLFNSRVNSHMKDVTEALESILNDLFGKLETKQLKATYVMAMRRLSTIDMDEGPEKAAETKKTVEPELKKLLSKALSLKKYRVTFQVSTAATFQETLTLGGLGLDPEICKRMIENMFHLPEGSLKTLPSPEQLAQLTIPTSSGSSGKKKQKREAPRKRPKEKESKEEEEEKEPEPKKRKTDDREEEKEEEKKKKK